MSANPATYTSFFKADHAAAQRARRHRRGRIGALGVQAGALLVLAALLAIPLFLIASVLSSAALPVGAWAHLGVLFAGSIKATVCALLVALPLGLAAAIFTAQFAAPRFRALFKPALEVLEAIPTVVLGLVAFATVSPWLKTNLATLLALVIAVPAALILGGLGFGAARRRTGWLPLWLLPALLALVAIIVAGFGPLQTGWITPASPWNAVLIGLALGLAAVPAVFSIAEDALTLIPPSHVQGALALGATRWQALRSIVLPAARAGVFAAIVLGASRCFGETMIVLMASGNTPIASSDPLEGLRALSAEIVLGLPESAPPSSAYVSLLLAALVLFGFTFALNLLAAHARASMHRRADRVVAFS